MGTEQRRKREAIQRRGSVLAAARKVFWRQGYAKATMAQIAKEAELATGTLYLYFTSKDALYAELLIEGYELLVSQLEDRVEQGGAPIDLAGGVIDAFFAFAKEYPEYFEILFFVLQRDDETWKKNFTPEQTQQLHGWRKKCTDVAATIVEVSGFGTAENRSHLVEAIWGMLAGVVFYFHKSESFDAIAAETKAMLLSGIFSGENGNSNNVSGDDLSK